MPKFNQEQKPQPVPTNHNALHNPSQSFQSHLLKNYRDDKSHEPSSHDAERDTEDIPEIQRNENEAAPLSLHELPRDVPTKPIYPGEGQWARPGIRHKPYIHNQQYKELEDTKEVPDGYDTFVAGQQLFDKKKTRLSNQFDEVPQKHRLENSCRHMKM